MADVHTPEHEEEPRGLGGWLILPMLGLFMTPAHYLVELSLSEIANALRVVGSSGQHAFIIFEVAANAAVAFVLPAALLVLFFLRNRFFPGLYIFWVLASLLFGLADIVGTRLLFADLFAEHGLPLYDARTWQGLTQTAATAVIWIPYMLVSRRVKNTFVN